jgi:hypothetical protein
LKTSTALIMFALQITFETQGRMLVFGGVLMFEGKDEASEKADASLKLNSQAKVWGSF